MRDPTSEAARAVSPCRLHLPVLPSQHATRPVSASTNLSQSVYFEGSWQSDDQEKISSAVADFESTQTAESLFSERPSWVCVAYDIGPSTLYCAHRPHLPSVLSARTAQALARSIRDAS